MENKEIMEIMEEEKLWLDPGKWLDTEWVRGEG